MSRLTQLYVFSQPLSFSQQLQKIAQLFDQEFVSIFESVDLTIVNGDRESESISPLQIEQVRDLHLEVLQAPLQHSLRIFVLMDIQTASHPALNAVLKLLEEPPTHVQFVLTTSQLDMVLPTVQSRCQIIHDFSEDIRQKAFSLPASLADIVENFPNRHLEPAKVFQISEEYREKPKAIELITHLIQQIQLHQTTHPTPFWTAFLQSALHSLQLLEQNVHTRLVVEELLFALKDADTLKLDKLDKTSYK